MRSLVEYIAIATIVKIVNHTIYAYHICYRKKIGDRETKGIEGERGKRIKERE